MLYNLNILKSVWSLVTEHHNDHTEASQARKIYTEQKLQSFGLILGSLFLKRRLIKGTATNGWVISGNIKNKLRENRVIDSLKMFENCILKAQKYGWC